MYKIKDGVNVYFLENKDEAEAFANQILINKRRRLSNITYNIGGPYHRQTRAEIKMITTVNVSEINKEIDSLSKEIRELDIKIQALNWTVDV